MFILKLFVLFLGFWTSLASDSLKRFKNFPHIVIILTDDEGPGDIQSFCPDHGIIPTPHVDKLARDGAMFMDAHTTSSVCSPSRYSIITGRYNWRTRLQSGVLHGISPPLMARGEATLGSLLKTVGYNTGYVGKWHIGMKMIMNVNDNINPINHFSRFNFSHHIEEGPNQAGFDEFFGLSASLDIPPYVYIRNHDFVDGDKVNHSPGKGVVDWGRQGPVGRNFNPTETLDIFVDEATAYLRKSISSNHTHGVDNPTFLFLSMTSPHTPVRPKLQFRDKHPIGWYGDFVMQTDDAVGLVLQQLDELNATQDTLVIFTTDNGFARAGAGYHINPNAPHHKASCLFRGQKSDIYDGGHRVPLVLKWPGVISPNTVVTEVVSLVDLYATLEEIVGLPRTENTGGPDSHSLLPLVTRSSRSYSREYTVVHSFEGKFGIRKKQWMLALTPNSGGWSPSPKKVVRDPFYASMQLYDMHEDPSQTIDLLATKTVSQLHKDVVFNLRQAFKNVTGRTKY